MGIEVLFEENLKEESEKTDNEIECQREHFESDLMVVFVCLNDWPQTDEWNQ